MKLSDLNTILGNRDASSAVRLSDYTLGSENLPNVDKNTDIISLSASKRLSGFTNVINDLTSLEVTSIAQNITTLDIALPAGTSNNSFSIQLNFNHEIESNSGALPYYDISIIKNNSTVSTTNKSLSSVTNTSYWSENFSYQASLGDEDDTNHIRVKIDDFANTTLILNDYLVTYYACRYEYDITYDEIEYGYFDIPGYEYGIWLNMAYHRYNEQQNFYTCGMTAPPDWPDPVFVFDFSGPWPNNGSGHYPGTWNVYGWCYVDAWDHPTISGQYVTGVEYHYYYNGGYAIGTKSCTNVTCRHPSHGMESTEQWEYPASLQVAWHSAPNPPCINTIDYSYSPTMDLPSGNIPQDLINWFDASQPIYRAWAASNNYVGQYLDNSLTDLFNNSNCSRSRYGSNMSSYHDDCLMWTGSYGTVRVKDIRTGVLTGGTCTWSNDGSTLTWKSTAKTLNTGNSSDRTLLGSIPSYNNLNDEGLNLFNNKIDAYMINHYAAQIETYFNNVDLNSVTRGSNGNIYVESNSTYITAISALSSNNSNCPNV